MTAVDSLDGMTQAGKQLNWRDAIVIIFYFCFVFAVGIWSSRRSKGESMSGYFLASRSMNWILVGSSLFASNIGSGHFIGLAGSGAATGIVMAGFELSATFILTLLGWMFVPVYMSSGVYTMPEYLRKRFGGQRIRVYLSILALFLYIFTKISADLYAGALFIQLALNKTSSAWMYISILILLAMAAIFTIVGGLTAVIWTDFVQTILMVVGAFILMAIAFVKVGGYQNMVTKYPYALPKIRPENGTCGIPPADYMHLMRSPWPGESDFPWTGMTFGLAINSIWYCCTDQVMVQRTLSSKSILHAKGAVIYTSYLKLLPLWLLTFPGMISRVLFPDRVGCVDSTECTRICGNPKGCTNIAYVELVIQLLPSGLAGLMLAVMLAALMSSLTSIFNSASTIFTVDLWTRFRRNPSEKERIVVGRLFVVALVIISVIWIPVIQASGNSKLFDYIQSITSFLAPPVCAVFLLALFWQRTNEPGAFWGLMIGLALGLIRFVMEFSYSTPSCGADEDSRPYFIQIAVGKIHYLHFGIMCFWTTVAVTISVSLLTKPIPSECLHRLTFWTRKSIAVRKEIDNYEKEEEENSKNKIITTMQIEETETQETSWIMRYILRLSGNPDSSEAQTTPPQIISEEDKAKEAADFLREDPFWKQFVNVNVIICLCFTSFVFGFYA